MSRPLFFIAALLLFFCTGWGPLTSSVETDPSVCHAVQGAPDYYQIDLVTTRKVRGARLAKGFGDVTYAASPFGVAISENGTYVLDIDIQMSNLTIEEGMSLVAWITTPQLDQIKTLGRLDENLQIQGQTDWNKFLLVITLEPSATEPGAIWTGPIVSRGMSRSGLMHTMAGHGPFETEPCAVYGY